MKCLDANHYDKDQCQLYFDNYNVCMKFWVSKYTTLQDFKELTILFHQDRYKK